jgi:hypothetical protein
VPLDLLGHGAVVGAPGFGCPAQPYQACPSRLGARFSLGNFVLCVHFRDERCRVIKMVGVRPIQIVHGEAAYHFGLGSTLASVRGFHGSHMRKRSPARSGALWLSRQPGGDGYSAQVIFSN